MTATNGGRPLPWHDLAPCRSGRCGNTLVVVEAMANGHGGPRDARVACAACGEGWRGTRVEVVKARRAEAAWRLHEQGLVHEDRGCKRCNAALMLDRERLCGPCVERDMRERQNDMFEKRWTLPGAQHGGG